MEPTDFSFIPYIEIYNNDYALFKKKRTQYVHNITVSISCGISRNVVTGIWVLNCFWPGVN